MHRLPSSAPAGHLPQPQGAQRHERGRVQGHVRDQRDHRVQRAQGGLCSGAGPVLGCWACACVVGGLLGCGGGAGWNQPGRQGERCFGPTRPQCPSALPAPPRAGRVRRAERRGGRLHLLRVRRRGAPRHQEPRELGRLQGGRRGCARWRPACCVRAARRVRQPAGPAVPLRSWSAPHPTPPHHNLPPPRRSHAPQRRRHLRQQGRADQLRRSWADALARLRAAERPRAGGRAGGVHARAGLPACTLCLGCAAFGFALRSAVPTPLHCWPRPAVYAAHQPLHPPCPPRTPLGSPLIIRWRSSRRSTP
jgi:hypothetical protein